MTGVNDEIIANKYQPSAKLRFLPFGLVDRLAQHHAEHTGRGGRKKVKTELPSQAREQPGLYALPRAKARSAAVKSDLADVSSGRNVGAELHRSSSLLAAASAESDSNDSSGENDSALHGIHLLCCPGLPGIRLASRLSSSRNFCAELHRSSFLAAASAESNSHDGSRENDQPLNTLHGFSPDA